MNEEQKWRSWTQPNAPRAGYSRPMDPFTFPPMPAFTAIEDRGDGTWWFLQHRESDDRFMLTDVPPDSKRLQATVYFRAYDGPWLQNNRQGRIRLLIRDGRIGYELVPGGRADRAISTQRVYTRIGMRRYALELIPNNWQRDGDVLAWTVAWSLAT